MILCQGRMRGDLSLFCFIFFFFSFSIFQRVACCCCFAPLTVKYRHLVGTLTNLWRPQWKDSTTTTTRKVEPLVLSKETFSLSLSIDYRLSLVVFEMTLTPKRCWVCVSACNGTLRQPTLLQREVVYPGMMDEVTARARHRVSIGCVVHYYYYVRYRTPALIRPTSFGPVSSLSLSLPLYFDDCV